MVSVCFVCLGNICRSPTAEGVMRHLVEEKGLSDHIQIDSAGTAAYHQGEAPDRRSIIFAKNRGVPLTGCARQFCKSDWTRFDYVLAMDSSNYSTLQEEAPDDNARARLFLLRSFDPSAPLGASVPDPYYGGDSGFEEVLDQCFAACRGLLAHIIERHGLKSQVR